MNYPGNITPQNTDDWPMTLKKLLLAMQLWLTGGGVPVPVTGASVTPNFFSEVAGSTTVIPIGAIGAGIIILTGTGTINGVAWPAGTPWNEPNKLAVTVTLVLGTPGTASIYYGT